MSEFEIIALLIMNERLYKAGRITAEEKEMMEKEINGAGLKSTTELI